VLLFDGAVLFLQNPATGLVKIKIDVNLTRYAKA